MSTAPEPARRSAQTDGWAALPSWLLSLLLHASLVVPLALVARTPVTPLAETARSVGIVSEAPQDAAGDAALDPDGQPAAGDDSPQDAPAAADPAAPDEILDAAPPVPLQLPTKGDQPARLGPGPVRPPGSLSSVGRDLLKPGTNAKPVPIAGVRGPGRGQGGTAKFFGATAEGSRIVYVIDASGSMSERNALAVAKAELLSSLQQLDSNQMFQVIFYNDQTFTWSREGSQQPVYFATDINKNLISQFIRGFRTAGGTQHLLALEAALRLNPDVIFFLTDAREPELTAGEIDKIQRRVASRCTIHTVEFGVGENINVDNFLKKLARATGGTASYRDVLKFK